MRHKIKFILSYPHLYSLSECIIDTKFHVRILSINTHKNFVSLDWMRLVNSIYTSGKNYEATLTDVMNLLFQFRLLGHFDIQLKGLDWNRRICAVVVADDWLQKWTRQWGRVTHICLSKLIITGSDNGLSPCWRRAIIWSNAENIVNWTPGYKLQWNFNGNLCIFIQENAFENVVRKLDAFSCRPQCVNSIYLARKFLQ